MFRLVFIGCTIILGGCKANRIVSSQSTSDRDTLAISIEPEIMDSIAINVDSIQSEKTIKAFKVKKERISIAAVGDIMMGTNFPNSTYLAQNTGVLWQEVSPVLSSTDLTFGNLEGVILNDGGDQKKCRNPKNCFLFRTPDSLATYLKYSGFDLISVANNHANDFGATGRINTQMKLDSLGIVHAGSIENPYNILTKKSFSIGFVAFSPNMGTASIHDIEKAVEYVQLLDSLTDIVIVSFHGGAEGAKNEHITREKEFYFGEDRGNVYEFAHRLVDKGADIIFGHGPHVLRGVEVYKERFIAYSLGNFLTYRRFNLQGPNAFAPILEINVDSEGKFLDGKIHSFIQDYQLGPIRDSQSRSLYKIRDLSIADFPESSINFTEDGAINYITN